MVKNDLFTQESPAYIQLYEKLRDDIIRGVFPYGTKLMSKRVIADRFGVSLVTVAHSLELLCDEGYLSARERSGYYVVFDSKDVITPYASGSETAGKDMMDETPNEESESAVLSTAAKSASSADLPAFPFSQYAKTMRRVISDYGEKLLERVPGQGVLCLREAISKYLARSRGLHVSADQIVIGAGSEYLYSLIVQLFGRDCIYGVEDPSYIKIEKVYRSLGANLELLKLGQNGIRSSALASSNANVLHISPYRSYPSGISTNASKRREYIHWANERGSYIVEDDFESEFSPSSKAEETVFSLADRDNVLYLNSFTRTISPSTRISYLILPRPLVNAFTQKLGFYACTVPGFDQYVLAEFIESGEFERHINRVRRCLRDI